MQRPGIWPCLEQSLRPAAVLAGWQAGLGTDFTNAAPFFLPTARVAEVYPCTNQPPCGCAHEVIAHDAPARIVAVCRCDPPECDPINLEPKHIVVHELNQLMFCRAIRRGFQFDDPPDERAVIPGSPNVWPVGVYGPLRSPVYLLSRPSEPEFLREVGNLITAQAAPFIILAPTDHHQSASVMAVLQRHHSAVISLMHSLVLCAVGRFRVTTPITPVLENFMRHWAEGHNTGLLLQDIHREIAAVRQDYHECRTAKDRLERMLAEGYFSFVQQVDPQSLKRFCAILATGTVAKASRTLGVPDSTLRESIRAWASLGPAYQSMLDLVAWRKKVGRKINVPLNDAVLHEKSESVDYPGLISDTIDMLLSMSGDNWKQQCDTIADLLRPYAPR